MTARRAPSRVPPHHISAEEAVLGAVFLARAALDDCLDRRLVADEFYKPAHQHIWDAIRAVLDEGHQVDAVTVAEELRRAGLLEDIGGLGRLLELQAATPAISNAGRYAAIIQHHARLRRYLTVAGDLSEAVYSEPSADQMTQFAAEFEARFADCAVHADDAESLGYWDSIAELDDGSDRDVQQPWLFRGMLRVGQRFLLLAPPGIGKSTILTQAAWCAENGIHALTGGRIETRARALVVELEGSKWDVVARSRLVAAAVARQRRCPVEQLVAPAFLHRAGGLDLGTAAGVGTLRRAVIRSGARLVCIGPSKHFGSPDPKENADTHAGRICDALNRVMDETGCAMMIETHTNRTDQDSPAGAERWRNWPDIGWGLRLAEGSPEHPHRDDTLTCDVRQFRLPRDLGVEVPSQMVRNGHGAPLPWCAPNTGRGRGMLWDAYAPTAADQMSMSMNEEF